MSSELAAAKRAATTARRALERRDERIRAAHAAGDTMRAIASELGLSHQRVHQIIHGK